MNPNYFYTADIDGVSIRGIMGTAFGGRYGQLQCQFTLSTPAHWGDPVRLVVYSGGGVDVNYSAGGTHPVEGRELARWMLRLWTVTNRLIAEYNDAAGFLRLQGMEERWQAGQAEIAAAAENTGG
jgi:hypothetical protein